MTENKIKLYSYWRSSCSYRVRIVLNLYNLNYEYIPVNLLKSEQLSENYSNNNNKMQQVPTFIYNNKIKLTQSLAIINYIKNEIEAAKNGNFQLNTSSSTALEMAEVINSGIQPVQNLAVLKQIVALGGDKMEFGKKTIEKGFHQIERLILSRKNSKNFENVENSEDSKYCDGDYLSIADVCLVPQVYNAKRFSVDLEEFPEILRVYNNLEKIEAFQLAHPDKQPDAVIA